MLAFLRLEFLSFNALSLARFSRHERVGREKFSREALTLLRVFAIKPGSFFGVALAEILHVLPVLRLLLLEESVVRFRARAL